MAAHNIAIERMTAELYREQLAQLRARIARQWTEIRGRSALVRELRKRNKTLNDRIAELERQLKNAKRDRAMLLRPHDKRTHIVADATRGMERGR
jgi:septal ring factor EnvC (AmiA/AmiB activator)